MNDQKEWDSVINDIRAQRSLPIFANFLPRVFAAATDLLISLTALSFLDLAHRVDLKFTIDSYGMMLLFLYSFLSEVSPLQATLGKKLIGLRVTNSTGGKASWQQVLGRTVAKLLTAVTLMLGMLSILFTARNQALHDLLSNTNVMAERV